MQATRGWVLVSALLLGSSASAANEQNVFIDFGAAPHEIEYDAARSRAYVTVPTLNKLFVIETNTWTVVDQISVAPSPRGVALALDGSKLYVAKFGAGSVAVLDPVTWNQTEIPLTGQLGDPRTWDVIEGKPYRLYVSSNPGSNGFAWIVQVELDNANVATRVASNNIIRCSPVFEGSPDFTALYIGECFSPPSVYKLDLTQPQAPIVAEDDHGNVGGTHHLETNPGGTRLHLASGQILETGALDVVGLVGGGVSRFDTDPSRIFVVVQNQIQTWNVNSQTLVDTRTLPCNISNPSELLVLPGEAGFLVLSGNTLCGVANIPPCPASVSSVCLSAPNSVGPGATLSASGQPNVGQNDFVLELDGAPPGRSVLFLYGDVGAQLPFGDGWLCLSPYGIIRRLGLPLAIDSTGHAELELDFQAPPLLNGPVLPYSTWRFQAWYRDAGGPGGTGVNTSDALRVTFCP